MNVPKTGTVVLKFAGTLMVATRAPVRLDMTWLKINMAVLVR